MPDSNNSSGFSQSKNSLVNFRSIDNSSNAAEIPDKKRTRNTIIIEDEQKDEPETIHESEFVDRSAQLSATLNSLAVINVAKLVKKDNKFNKFPSIKKNINIFYGPKD